MTKNTHPTPPKHLTTAAKRLWISIYEDVDLDAPALLLLNTLAEQWDRMNQARELIASEGSIVKDRFDQAKPHPAISIEVNAIAAMTRCWRLLGFDQVPPGDIGRPAGS